MLELYFNDGNFLPESREEEQSAETVLNIMLAGKTTDTEMCIWPCFYHAPMCKGVLINMDDGTTLRILKTASGIFAHCLRANGEWRNHSRSARAWVKPKCVFRIMP